MPIHPTAIVDPQARIAASAEIGPYSIVGAEVEGVFTLFAILFTLLGVAMAGLGIVGEYVGRIYEQVRGRPRFSVRRAYGLGAERSSGVGSRESRVGESS